MNTSFGCYALLNLSSVSLNKNLIATALHIEFQIHSTGRSNMHQSTMACNRSVNGTCPHPPASNEFCMPWANGNWAVYITLYYTLLYYTCRITKSCHQTFFSGVKMVKMHWRPAIHSGPRWGSLQHSPRCHSWTKQKEGRKGRGSRKDTGKG